MNKDDFEKRLKSLQGKIKTSEKEEEESKKSSLTENITEKTDKVFNYGGVRYVIELISAIFVGGCIGLLLDKLFHTLPLFLIIFILLGFVAGIFNIYRISKKDFQN